MVNEYMDTVFIQKRELKDMISQSNKLFYLKINVDFLLKMMPRISVCICQVNDRARGFQVCQPNEITLGHFPTVHLCWYTALKQMLPTVLTYWHEKQFSESFTNNHQSLVNVIINIIMICVRIAFRGKHYSRYSTSHFVIS